MATHQQIIPLDEVEVACFELADGQVKLLDEKAKPLEQQIRALDAQRAAVNRKALGVVLKSQGLQVPEGLQAWQRKGDTLVLHVAAPEPAAEPEPEPAPEPDEITDAQVDAALEEIDELLYEQPEEPAEAA